MEQCRSCGGVVDVRWCMECHEECGRVVVKVVRVAVVVLVDVRCVLSVEVPQDRAAPVVLEAVARYLAAPEETWQDDQLVSP